MSPGVSGIILSARRLPNRGLIRVRRTGRGPCLFWSGEGVASGPTATGALSARSDRLMLEVLMWLVGRDSEQGVMLRVCSKAFQRRLFGMTWLEVGARRALGAVAGRGQGAPRTCRCIETEARSSLETSCSRQGAPRTCRCIETSRPGCPSRRWPSVREHHAPGALRLYVKRTLPVAPDVREHHAPVGALRPSSAAISMSRWTSQGAPRTCRCIETPC